MKKTLILLPMLALLVACNSSNTSSTNPSTTNGTSSVSPSQTAIISNPVISTPIVSTSTPIINSSTVNISSSSIDYTSEFTNRVTEFANNITKEGYVADGYFRRSVYTGIRYHTEIRKDDMTYLKTTQDDTVEESLIFFNKEDKVTEYFKLTEYANIKYFYTEVYPYDIFNIIDSDYLLSGIPTDSLITKSNENSYRISFKSSSIKEKHQNTLAGVFTYEGSAGDPTLLFTFSEKGLKIIANTPTASELNISFINGSVAPFSLDTYPTLTFTNIDLAKRYESKVKKWNVLDPLWVIEDCYGYDETNPNSKKYYVPIELNTGAYYAERNKFIFPSYNSPNSPSRKLVNDKGEEVSIKSNTVRFQNSNYYQIYELETDFKGYLELDIDGINGNINAINIQLNRIDDPIDLTPIDGGSLAPGVIYTVSEKLVVTPYTFYIPVTKGSKFQFSAEVGLEGSKDYTYINKTDLVDPTVVKTTIDSFEGAKVTIYEVIADVTEVHFISYGTTHYRVMYNFC